MRRLLILHADDFGLSEKVNAGILLAHVTGKLTSASIMAAAPAFADAIAKCRSVPTLDIGVHLTLVEEKPVLDANELQTLVNGFGTFHKSAWQFVLRYFCGLISMHDVRRELDAQIQKVLHEGISISHLDSHQHLHMLPGIFAITVDLAKKHNIPCIRYPHEKLHRSMLREWRLLPRILQMLTLGTFCSLSCSQDIVRTDHFFGFLYGGNLNRGNLLKILRILPQRGVSEIMCHPGLDGSDASSSHWRYHWQDELDALIAAETTEILAREGISLISYRDLTRCKTAH